MSIQKHVTEEKLDLFSFYWTEAKFVIAACSLIFGATPVIMRLVDYSSPFFNLSMSLLKISWIVTGLVSGYLLYRWFESDKKAFGTKAMKENVLMFIVIITGINLGITGLMNRNYSMEIFQFNILFILTGIFYLWGAFCFYRTWEKHDRKLFDK